MRRSHAVLVLSVLSATSATACFEPRERIRTGDDTGGASGAGGAAGTAASGAGATAGSSGAGTGGASGASSSGGSGAMSSGGAGATGGASSSGGTGLGGTAGAGGFAGAAGTGGAPSAPEVALARFPWNGFYTGSSRATQPEGFYKPLRPRFVWDAAAGATHYELELDDSCSVATMASCAFDSPEVQEQTDLTDFTLPSNLTVKTTPPVGTRYFWRVRACNDVGCSDWSAVRYLNVGRLEQDFNGDGYPDLVMGDRVYYGDSGGVGSTFFEGEESWPVRWGDVNGDGFTDLVYRLGPLLFYTGPDAWGVYYGSEAGLSELSHDEYLNPTGSDDLFVFSVCSGADWNSDGFDDAMVLFYDQAGAEPGRIGIFTGSVSGLSSTPSDYAVAPNTPSVFSPDFDCRGDFNGDGHPDIVVGDVFGANPTPGEGRLLMVFGNSAGDPSNMLEVDNPTGETDGNLGWFVAMGDVDGDGLTDVAASAQGTSQRVFLFKGTRDAATPLPVWGEVPVTFATDLEYWLDLRDVTRDARADLLMSGDDSLYVLEGTDVGLSTSQRVVRGTPLGPNLFVKHFGGQVGPYPNANNSIVNVVAGGELEARVHYMQGSEFTTKTYVIE